MKGVVGGVGGRLLTTIVGTVAISLGSHSSFAATRFVDLTAKEYKGADSDLAGFYLNHLGVNCPEGKSLFGKII